MTVPATRLVGWKAIAGHFSRDERTVMRWAADRGMPVERVAGHGGSSVYAWPAALDAWLHRSGEFSELNPVESYEAAAVGAPPAIETKARWRPKRSIWLTLAAFVGVVTAISVWLSFRSARTPEPRYASFRDSGARDAYLQARFDGSREDRASLLRAVAAYGDAIARDPGVAASYVGLANTYFILPQYSAMGDDDAFRRATAAVQVAASISPGAMEVWCALALVSFWGHDLPTARKDFAKALLIAPNDAATHHWFAIALSANGEQTAALKEIQIARTLDPTSAGAMRDHGRIAYLSGRRVEGRRLLNSLAQTEPNDAALHRALAQISLVEGRHVDYLKEAAVAAKLSDAPDEVAMIAREDENFRLGGAARMFQTMGREARERTTRTNSSFYSLARISAAVGRKGAAINALAPACIRHEIAASGARGDLYLAQQITPQIIQKLCGGGSLVN